MSQTGWRKEQLDDSTALVAQHTLWPVDDSARLSRALGPKSNAATSLKRSATLEDDGDDPKNEDVFDHARTQKRQHQRRSRASQSDTLDQRISLLDPVVPLDATTSPGQDILEAAQDDVDSVGADVSRILVSTTTKSGGRKPNINVPSHLRRIALDWLRYLPMSDRWFWRETYTQQRAIAISDVGCTDQSRGLGLNECTTMGLNEIAAQEGSGYFFWHKTRDGWHKPVKPPACPLSRQVGRPGDLFPAISYMKYTWTDTTRMSFFRTSHRSRYLRCDGLMGGLPSQTPLYGIQFASNLQYGIYCPPQESLVVYATPSTFYVATSSEVREAVGLWPSTKKAPRVVGTDQTYRVDTVPSLFEDKYLKDGDGRTQQIHLNMQVYKVQDLKTLYHKIQQYCGHGGIRPTFTVRELRHLTPRPSNPEPGVSLGTSLNPNSVELDSSMPPSRKGTRLPEGGTKRRTCTLDETEDTIDGDDEWEEELAEEGISEDDKATDLADSETLDIDTEELEVGRGDKKMEDGMPPESMPRAKRRTRGGLAARAASKETKEASGEVAGWINAARTWGGFVISYVQINWAAAQGTQKEFGIQSAIVAAAFVVVIYLQFFGEKLRRKQGPLNFKTY